MRLRAILSALALLSGCSTPTPPADPHGFPDAARYAAADTGEFLRNAPGFNGLSFQTPDGLVCGHNGFDSMLDPSTVTVSCSGEIPAQGPGRWRVTASTKQAAVIAQSSAPAEPGRILPAGKRLSYQGIDCVVDEKVTACRVGGHGFVLTSERVTLY